MRATRRRVGTAPISTVILIVVLAMLAAPPLVAEAQPAGKVPRVGYLNASSAASATWVVEAFRQGLRELGYIEGTNILIEYRWADTMYGLRPCVEAGGLMFYGADVIEIWQRAARLRRQDLERHQARRPAGRAADKVELVINLKAARSISLTLPEPMLLQATEVIR